MLTGKNRQTARTETDRGQKLFFQNSVTQNNEEIIDRVCKVAESKGVAPSHVSLPENASSPRDPALLIDKITGGVSLGFIKTVCYLTDSGNRKTGTPGRCNRRYEA